MQMKAMNIRKLDLDKGLHITGFFLVASLLRISDGKPMRRLRNSAINGFMTDEIAESVKNEFSAYCLEKYYRQYTLLGVEMVGYGMLRPEEKRFYRNFKKKVEGKYHVVLH